MFFLCPLQIVMDNRGVGEEFELSATNKAVTYERGDKECTKSLRRFLKKLEIVRQLSQVFPANKGIFRIPQLKSFLYHTSRTLSDKHIAQLSTVVIGDTKFKKPLLVLDRLGN